jgi:hypothetical protein
MADECRIRPGLDGIEINAVSLKSPDSIETCRWSTEGVDAWYAQFFHEGKPKCDAWNNATCPVVRYQMSAYQRPRVSPIFFPEPLWGRPKPEGLVFLGINPGQDLNEENDKRFCPNTEGTGPLRPSNTAEYRKYYDEAADRARSMPARPEFSDNVTKAALAIQKALDGASSVERLAVPGPENADALSRLVILNMVHCKCPQWSCLPCTDAVVKQNVYRRCATLTRDVLDLLRPKAVVCFGQATHAWLEHTKQIRDGLKAGDHYDCGDTQRRFVLAHHPSSRGGKYALDHVQTIVRLLLESGLGVQHEV